MQYHRVDYDALRAFCIQVFQGYGFDSAQSEQMADVRLDEDLSGIESHGIQRLIRYHKEITGGLIVSLKGAEVHVEAEEAIAVQIDGEVVFQKEVTFRMAPEKLNMLFPAGMEYFSQREKETEEIGRK